MLRTTCIQEHISRAHLAWHASNTLHNMVGFVFVPSGQQMKMLATQALLNLSRAERLVSFVSLEPVHSTHIPFEVPSWLSIQTDLGSIYH